MANLKVDLSLNDGGLKLELQKDKKAVSDFSKEVTNSGQSVTDSAKKFQAAVGSINNYKKQLAQLSKEVISLEMTWKSLSDEQKNSDFGRALAQQLNEAKDKAAEFKDLIIDSQNEIKQLSSDSFKSDAFAAGIDVVSTSMSAMVAVTQLAGGETENLQKAIAKLVLIQTVSAAGIKVINALQAQSALMLGVRKAQEYAAATAIAIRTAAEGKSVVATKAATVAQAAFNAVAKANPYVLLGTAVLTVAAAIGTYMLTTKKAIDVEKEQQKALHDASVEGQKDAVEESVKLRMLYNKTQDVTLAKEQRLKAVKDMRTEYPGYFKDLSDEAILAGQASDKYKQLADDIIAVAKARAYQKKIEELTSKNILYQDQLDADKAWQDANRATHEANQRNIEGQSAARGFIPNAGVPYSGVDREVELEWSYSTERIKENSDALRENQTLIEKYTGEIRNLSDAQHRYNSNTNIIKPTVTKHDKKTDKKTPTFATGSLSDLENQLSELQKKYKDGLITLTPADYQKKVADLQSAIESKKIELGIVIPEDKVRKQLDELSKKDSALQRTQQFSSFDIAVGNDKPQGQRDLSFIQNEMNFNDALLKQLNELKDAYLALGDAGKSGYDKICAEIDNVTNKQTQLGTKAKEYTDHNKKLQENTENWSKIGDAVSTAGSAFSSLGGSFEIPVLNAAGIIANAIATMIQAYTQAAASPAVTSTGWGWLGFALTGAAQLAAVISQLHSLSGFASGGVVSGGSFVGDKQLVRVNSGEMILTSEQLTRLFRVLNGSLSTSNSGAVAQYVEWHIKGSDLYGVLRNYGKQQSSVGRQIGIK